ncbi:hypothetical protein ACEWY4_014956 [Coilia grayii]|uniref:Hydroperoxide isomerase ALOXE3-like n=1 Tax=Coilia grayii TaxID=363190 RepID=A0ABD1JTS9_9TELE
MLTYKVSVTTGSMLHAGTCGNAFITLTGTEGKSDKIKLQTAGQNMIGETETTTVSTASTLGSLLALKLKKEPYFNQEDWFCAKIEVTTPDNDIVHFPCYNWLSINEEVKLRPGEAKKPLDEEHDLLKNLRHQELELRKQTFRWRKYKDGLPEVIDADFSLQLPKEIRFSFTKDSEVLYTRTEIQTALSLKGLITNVDPWRNFEDMKKAFRHHKTSVTDYVEQHWKEDDFFGYQILNGYNPMLIECCKRLPPNFAVTDAMVKPFLSGSCLSIEMQRGNIFLVDYRRIAGLPAPVFDGKQQYITAPLCLLYKNPEDKLLPIAIQLKQEPGPENPVFLPSDSEYDWLLAKAYLRNADFHEHEANSHYWRTHGLTEVFIVSTLRNLPTAHPLYKLLFPHCRYTLHINTDGRHNLFGPKGVYTNATNLGGQGQFDLMKKWFSEMTYSALCLPEDICNRGLESLPNFFYRDDGQRLWDILNSYVRKMVEHYYLSDLEVKRDSELQDWIKEIFVHGFLGRRETGIPKNFQTVGEVVKFVTMVIFNVTGQHSAVNTGQFDFGGWLPNSPNSMQKPPPTRKGVANERLLLDSLPSVKITALGAVFRWSLSTNSTDFIRLGQFPDELFCEDAPLRIIRELQAELSILDNQIDERNKSLPLPYLYLQPKLIENSTAI